MPAPPNDSNGHSGTFDKAIELAVGTVGKGMHLLESALRPPGLHKATPDDSVMRPGGRPGIEHLPDIDNPPESGDVTITCIDYSVDRLETREIDDLDSLLDTPRPDWVQVRWINVSGLHANIVNKFRIQYGFHTLVAEDVLHVPQRPKIECFDDYIFTTVRMLRLIDLIKNSDEENPLGDRNIALDAEQVSLFLYSDTLITFQEKPGDVWAPIRERLNAHNTRMRRNGTNYLLYALLDAIVDHCFPVLEQYGDVLEELELLTLENPAPKILHRIHSVKRELALLRRIVWPTREVIDQLYREEDGHISDATRPFLRDVYEHTIQIVEIIESYREMAGGLTDLYMSAISNRMNEIMKVLTIMASVFIPLTFVAGVYGMNFENMPELGEPWAYPAVWVIFVALAGGMLWFFRHKGWIGRK